MFHFRHWRSIRRRAWAGVLILALAAACGRAREYELRGQVLAVDSSRGQITIKHEDIKGFMPGMTMPFKVREAALLAGLASGDMVRATLVVEDAEGYLTSIERTGHTPVAELPPARPRVDALTPGDEIRDVELLDETGAVRRISEWRGRTLAVTFIYTRCPLPDFCPLMDRQFAAVQQAIIDDPGLRGPVQLLSISFDPAFDTPTVLATHAKKVGADPGTWIFLTGAETEIESFAALFGVSVMREGADPANVVHNLRTAVIGRDGRLVKVLNGIQWDPSELVSELRTAVGVR
jgi:protein SCO1/2